MLEKTKSSYETVEEKSIKNTMLYLKGININEESYETKILLEENIDNVIKFQVVYDGDEKSLCYDVSDTISLEEFIKSYKLKKKDICTVIDSIDGILSSIENFLISENSLSLDLKLIRVERLSKSSFNLKFLLIPNFKSSFSYELSKFLIKILRYVDVEDKNALQLAYGLFVRSSKDNYTINDLMELVNIMRDHKKQSFKDVDLEALNAYDEEIVSEIHDEILENEVIENVPELSEFIDAEKNMEIVMDKSTVDVLKEEVLDKFDDEPKTKNVIKFKKKFFDLKPKKRLNAHFNTNIAKSALFPAVCIIVPMFFYLLYGANKFISMIPMLCLCEIIMVTLFVIRNISRTK